MKYSESIGIEYSTFDTTATEDVKNKYEELIAMKTELDEMDTQLGKNWMS